MTYFTKMLQLALCVLLFKLEIVRVDAANILAYYPLPFLSHQASFYQVTNELLKRGHKVTVITPNPRHTMEQAPKNLTEIDVNRVSYAIKEEFMKKFAITLEKNTDPIIQFSLLSSMVIYIIEQQLKEPQVQNILKMDKRYFDLILLEACARPALIVSHIFNAPVVQISSYGALRYNLEAIGASTHLLYSPFSRKLHSMSLWDKVKELRALVGFEYVLTKSGHVISKLFTRQFGPNVPTELELWNKIDMLYINMNPIWAGNQAVPSALIYTGGSHLRSQKELPEDLKSYLDGSKNGVIYMSFGTNIDPSNITPEVRKKFINVLSGLKYDVLWKWNQDEFLEKSMNIKISKWVPQADLLRHPKVVLFITQGGLQSTDEAIVAGVPVIGIPLAADQWYNVEKYVYFNVGKKIDITNFTEESLREAIMTVIGNASYRENMEKLRKILYDQPQAPLERGVWWLEYVIRHGGARHLRAPAANMTWAEYCELELVCIVLAAALFTAIIVTMTIKYLCRQVARLINMKISTKIKTQ